jgi:hypothetical protein
MSCPTIITYAGGTPTITGTVTLFNSVTAFPPGGSFHLLGQQWFQYSIRTASDGGAGTGTITGSFSLDKGVTWRPFYTSATADADDDDAAAVADVVADEVYVGLYKDVRFQFLNAVEAPTVFEVNLALHPCKPTSKVTRGHVLHDNDAAAAEIAVDAP